MAKNDNKKAVEKKEEVKTNDGIIPGVKKEDDIAPSELMEQVIELKNKLEELANHEVREVALAAADSAKHANKILGLAKFIDMALEPKKYAK